MSEKFSSKKSPPHKKIILVGNPNVGKSVIFNVLTGKRANVSNYPGTTVEISTGFLNTSFGKFEVIDTPGVNSLIPTSVDEKITRDILIGKDIHNVILIGDAKNLRRALLLCIQLAELEIPFVLVLNMWDEAREKLIYINIEKLKNILGVEVIPTIATQRWGINKVKESIKIPKLSNLKVAYPEFVESAITKIEKNIPDINLSKRGIALMLLSDDKTLFDFLKKELKDKIENLNKDLCELKASLNKRLSYNINRQKISKIEDILEKVVIAGKPKKVTFLEIAGRFSMHPVWGIPILLFVLYVMYQFVGVFGAQICVGFMEEIVFGKYINPISIKIVNFVIPIKFLQELFVGDFGLITMALTYSIAIILPIVGTFFIFFGFIEDVGYLPRLSIMSDKIFRIIGLNGKAILPMILGLGCGTMAVIAARILNTRKERIIITLLLVLSVPCSAQLGVILGMLSGISVKATFIWLLIVVFVILLVGYISSKVISGETSSFILEIPPLRLPKLSNILMKTLARIEWYLKEAVPLFIFGTFLLFVFDKLKVLKVIESIASPVVVGFLGLPVQVTHSFIMGFLRRDYGAAGLYALQEKGMLEPIQILVSLVVITLFLPCIAQFLVIVKERGLKVAISISIFVFLFAFVVGGILNFILRMINVSL